MLNYLDRAVESVVETFNSVYRVLVGDYEPVVLGVNGGQYGSRELGDGLAVFMGHGSNSGKQHKARSGFRKKKDGKEKKKKPETRTHKNKYAQFSKADQVRAQREKEEDPEYQRRQEEARRRAAERTYSIRW